MKYIPSSYTCIYFDILLTSDLSEVSGFQMLVSILQVADAFIVVNRPSLRLTPTVTALPRASRSTHDGHGP